MDWITKFGEAFCTFPQQTLEKNCYYQHLRHDYSLEIIGLFKLIYRLIIGNNKWNKY